MIQEDKQLLFKDLCARLPYEVKVKYWSDSSVWGKHISPETCLLTMDILTSVFKREYSKQSCLPYLRPMSSMTREEKKIQKDYIYHFSKNSLPNYEGDFVFEDEAHEYIDWLNAHHFDYRGLIERGLAIAVTEEYNPYKE